jgi:hypothetical protein
VPFLNIEILAVLAIAATIIGCSAPQPTSVPRTVVPSEHQIAASEKRQGAAVQETQQTSAPAYQPCVQGPETLRFFDRLAAENRTITGDDVSKVLGRFPPLARQRLLDIIDAEAASGRTGHVTVTGNRGPSFLADVAEEFISDCSHELARMSAASAVPDMWPAAAVARLWQSNLEFMKWWLSNHWQKSAITR